jgi:serine/threonine protein kinase
MPGIIGNYKIHRTLGQGASCKVKLGFEISSGRKVAVKIMNKNIDEKIKKLILTEVSAMSILKHQNVV